MPELLLELLSEEIPARMQARAAEDLCSLLGKALAEAGLPASDMRGFHGPRRIGLIAAVPAATEAAEEERRGPRVDAPEAALQGFLRSTGLPREALVQRESGKALHWFALIRREGRPAAEVIAAAVPPVLRAFPWPKSMRWGGTSSFVWVRPLQRILCVLDGETVRFDLRHGEDDGHGIASGNLTEGHRLLAPGAFAVASAAGHEAGLRARYVIRDAAERMRAIREGIAALAAAEGLEPVPDEGLLAELAGLVEWPVPLLGRIDAAFMDLPPEVMRTTMRVNQRYVSLRHKDGTPAPRFALVANMVARDGGAAIIAGNERVLRARLSDARFFWDQDRKERLESRLPRLDQVVFHAKLGTQGERVRRLEALARLLAPMVGAEPSLAARAARLAKADLASGMVGEFPELQGVMGRYYALHDGEERRVAEAIAAHYRPLGPGDEVPREPVSVAVALADKLDQLAGFFAAGERPTGSGDPYALRRAALGVIRILRENGLRLPLRHLVAEAFLLYPAARAAASVPEFGMAVATEVVNAGWRPRPGAVHPPMVEAFAQGVVLFLLERLRIQLRAEGARHDILSAAIGAGEDDDLLRVLARADALAALVSGPEGANLLAAYTRAASILRAEERRDGPHDGAVEPELLEAAEERALAAALDAAEPAVAAALAAERFAEAMAALAALRAPLDAFFDRVTVNAPEADLRRNRLRLLSRLRRAMHMVADFGRIEG
ncbi:MAG: glycine--tRNA ligase subunit beta [Acetobacteraceae bacterium]|nr:glycine--tRNA ligase subunit beta [Acetobacteraceae bacterium]